MDYIFAYANTASLLKQLNPVADYNDMRPGDVFIQKGNPYGHAVIVLDVAKNAEGKKVFMVGQSYMPAQETQVLVNNNKLSISPWYELGAETIVTPEWVFKSTDLRRF
ncbi:ribosomal protein S16 [Elusimicrobium posterum]